LEKYHTCDENLMKNNMFSMETILLVVILTASTIMPVLALDDTVQHIAIDLNGFVVKFGCCPDTTIQIQGSIITEADGTETLSQQIGSIMIDKKTYALKFEPLGNASTSPDDICLTSTNHVQHGVVELTGTDGIVLKGTADYSWGTALGCPDGDASFTNFSGKFQDPQGQTIEFFTGNDSLPIIQ
jgi:hypothetical protein